MEDHWYIGTSQADSVDEHGRHHSTLKLSVPISEDEHDTLREAAHTVMRTLRGVLFRLVFSNHQALVDLLRQMHDAVKSDNRRQVNWIEAHLQVRLALANWLGSVRWLLDHTKSRFHDTPEKLARFDDARTQEFDNHFAYRLTYKLRDYATHSDLPPVWMNVTSEAVGPGDRIDSLTIHLRPQELLAAWDGWGGPLKRDLRQLTEPIELLQLVNEAMASIQRIVTAIIVADANEHRSAARSVVQATDRLPQGALDGGAAPMLFAISFDDGGSIKHASPTPLPIAEARDMLNPPPVPRVTQGL